MIFPVLFFQLVLAQTIQRGESNVRCTMHDYQTSLVANPTLWDNAPGWCGIRYSVLNVARIVAVNSMTTSMCNQCIQIVGQGGTTQYVLAVDQKGAPGLDIAPDSYQALFPGGNNLDPHVCSWSVVNPSMCGQICFGSAEECTLGVRNLLMASLLPSYPVAYVGLGKPRVSSNAVSNAPPPISKDPPFKYVPMVPTTTCNSPSPTPSASSPSSAATVTSASQPKTTTAATYNGSTNVTAPVYGSTNHTTGSLPPGIISSSLKLGNSAHRISAFTILCIVLSV